MNRPYMTMNRPYRDTPSPAWKKPGNSTGIFPVTGAFSAAGELYIASNNSGDGGLYCFSEGYVTKIRDGQTRSVTFDSNDHVWITHIDANESTMKVLMLDNDEWIDLTGNITEIFNPNVDKQMTATTAPDGGVWINNAGKLAIYSNDSWIFHDGGSNVAPRYLKFDRDGTAWGYGAGKLYRLNDDYIWEAKRVIKDGILPNPWFMTSTTDGNIWITDEGFLLKYTPSLDSLWTRVQSPYDLATDTVTSLAYTHDNRLVCGHGIKTNKNNAGLSVLDGREWFNYTSIDQKKISNVYDMTISWDDDIIVYCDAGLRFFDGATWTADDSLRANNDDMDVRDMLVDDRGYLWIGSFWGLIKYDFTVRPDTLRPPEDYDRIWKFGFEKFFVDSYGLLYMQNEVEGVIIRYDESQANNKKWYGLFKDINITDFVVDRDGFIWATRHDNLVKYFVFDTVTADWEYVESSDTEEPIYLENASFCNYDADGRLWASGYNNTGFLDDNVWYRIPELSQGGASEWAWSRDGRLAFNAFRILDNGQKEYYGVFEYRPNNVIADVEELPHHSFSVKQNYPNPFNSSTLIPFELNDNDRITITIYNVAGQKVRTLVQKRYPAGNHAVQWNADNDSGENVASGLYFYHIHTSSGKGVGKMLYLR